jgi:hypothetical protein
MRRDCATHAPCDDSGTIAQKSNEFGVLKRKSRGRWQKPPIVAMPGQAEFAGNWPTRREDPANTRT